MSYVEISGKQIEVDEDGFITDPELWNDDIVRAFAHLEGVDELTENHWKVINYLRDYWKKFGSAPHNPQALQGDRLHAAADLRDVSLRAGQGGLQVGRASQTHRLRLILAEYPPVTQCLLLGYSLRTARYWLMTQVVNALTDRAMQRVNRPQARWGLNLHPISTPEQMPI